MPALQCGLDALLGAAGAASLEECTVLDLQGEALDSAPVLDNPYGNGTITLNANDTLRLLSAAMSSNASARLTTLLLSGSPSLGNNPISGTPNPAGPHLRVVGGLR